MPALPDRSGRDLPDSADVVVIGGGYAGINAARELARRGRRGHPARGAHARLGRLDPQWRDRPLRATSGVHASSSGATARTLGAALYQDTLDGYETVKRLIADGVDRLRLPRVRATSSWPGRPAHGPELEHAARRACASIGVERRWCRASESARRSAPTRTTAALVVPGSGLAPPGPLLRGSGRGRRPRRRRPARGRPGAHDPAPGATAGSSSRPSAGRSWHATCSSPPTATRTASRRRCAAGSSRSGATSSPPSRSPRTWPASCRPRAARSSTPRTSSTTGTCRPTGGWSSAGGRASCRRRSIRRRRSSTRAAARSTRSWPATGSSTPGAATSGSPSTGCRTSGGRRTASPTRWAAAGPAWR